MSTNQPHIIFDLDETLIPTTDSYQTAIDELVTYIQTETSLQASEEKIRKIQNEIDISLTNEKGFSIDKFLESFRKTYLVLCSDASVVPDTRHEAEICMIVEDNVRLNVNQYQQRGWIDPQIPTLLQKLKNVATLSLLTKGDTDAQWRKIEAMNITNYIPPERIRISDRKTDKDFLDMIPPTKTIQNSWKVGDSVTSDINPALSLGLNAIHVEPQETWNYEEGDLLRPNNSELHTVSTVTDIESFFVKDTR